MGDPWVPGEPGFSFCEHVELIQRPNDRLDCQMAHSDVFVTTPRLFSENTFRVGFV